VRCVLRIFGSCLLLTLTLAPARGQEAQVVYVTDELRLGLYESELTNGRPFKTLLSGAALTVLERSLMSIRVRTEDGEEGWVKTAYIVEKEPGRRIAERLRGERDRLEEDLSGARGNLDVARERVATLEKELAAAQLGIEELPALKRRNAELSEELAGYGARVPLPMALLGAALGLGLGGLIGYLSLDRRVRRHFGGIRPY
jgi:hypothetical protein